MIRRKMQEQGINPMFTILIGTMLATLATHFFLTWATSGMTELDWVGRLLLTVGGVTIYGGIIGGTFYLFLPMKGRQSKS